MTEQANPREYYFGRSRFRGIPAFPLAVIIGIALAAFVAGVQLVAGEFHGSDEWPSSTMNGSPWTMCLAWYMVVDRSTLRGATHNPESGITKTRYAHAATDAFHVTIAVCGLTAFVIGDRLPPTVTWTLRSVFGLLVLVFGISYLIRRYRRVQ